MTSTASSSISRRTSASGQRSPRMCSLSASPLPTPRVKRPSSRRALVAAAWATIAGWMRTVGQVTPVVDRQVGGLRDRADHRPHERAVALLVVPRVVVVGDPQRVEAGLLGAAGQVDELARAELLAGEEATDAHGDDLPGLRPGQRGQAADCRPGGLGSVCPWRAEPHSVDSLADDEGRRPRRVGQRWRRGLAGA